jgi:hypothetical protein
VSPDGEDDDFLNVEETGLRCCHGRFLLGGVEGDCPDMAVQAGVMLVGGDGGY